MTQLSRGSRRLVQWAWCAVAATACASSGSSPSTATPQSRPTGGSNAQMTAAEFHRPEFRTIGDAIRALHPEWLQPRGGTTHYSVEQPNPMVGIFIEGQRRGVGAERLNELVLDDVKSVRYLKASESIVAYGPEWSWGAIVVTMAR